MDQCDALEEITLPKDDRLGQGPPSETHVRSWDDELGIPVV